VVFARTYNSNLAPACLDNYLPPIRSDENQIRQVERQVRSCYHQCNKDRRHCKTM